jgi:hypothetical protein
MLSPSSAAFEVAIVFGNVKIAVVNKVHALC